MKRHRLTRRQALTAGLVAAAALATPPAIGRSSAPTRAIGGPAYGTWWNVTLPRGAETEALRVLLEQTLERIDRLMSPWRPDSAITRFNRRQSTDWQPVDKETAAVAGAALALRKASGGAFDPAVGPLVGRWGFGPIAGREPPRNAEFAVADDALRKGHETLTLDLCGIAKGYALDQMAATLLDGGQDNFVIDLGGEIAARGHHPEGRSWRVAVEDPRPGGADAAAVLLLDDHAVATSGDRVNGYTLEARRYSHIIDPATAEPVEGMTASVTVLAKDAMTADGWATALMAAGASGPDLARRRGVDALFLLREGSGLTPLSVGKFNLILA